MIIRTYKSIALGEEAITMSAFSNPTNSRFGPIYEIPRVMCNVNGEQRKSEKCIRKNSRNICGILSIWIYPKI